MRAKWSEITAGEIISPLQGELISGPPESTFSGLCTDSRKMIPGQLFWALKGERYDGHDFLRMAIDKDAAGIVIQKGYRPEIPYGRDPAVISVTDTLKAIGDLAGWWRHQHSICVAAITGSAGKTTTKEMTAKILEIDAMTLKNKGTFNNLVGLPLTILLMEDAHSRAVLEMGMNRPGEIARLTEIADPDIGLITNVARAHLEGLGDINGVAKAKVELLDKISSTGQVVLNGDDKLLMKTAAPFRRNIMTYGIGSGYDIEAHNIRNLGREGSSFELQYHGTSTPVRLRVPGLQNIFNAMAASAIAFCMKGSPDHISEGLNGFEGINGRFMFTPLPGGATLIDDTYNSNPYSLNAAIDSIKDLLVEKGRVIVGLGEMMELGNETGPAHLEAGRMVAELGAHYFVAMGEHAQEMIEGAISNGVPSAGAVAVNTHKEMAQKLRKEMKKDDLILLKGSRKTGLEKVAEALKSEHLSKHI